MSRTVRRTTTTYTTETVTIVWAADDDSLRQVTVELPVSKKGVPMKNSRFVLMAGGLCALGGLIQAASGSVEALFPVFPPAPAFIWRNLLVALSDGLILLGVIGLARSGMVGDSWLAKLSLGIAILGSALFVVFEPILLVRFELGQMLLGFVAPFTGLGMLLTGIATLRAQCWQGWQRFTPLLCGLYPFVIMLPVFALTGGPNFWAIGGWGLCWLLLGIALWATAREQGAISLQGAAA